LAGDFTILKNLGWFSHAALLLSANAAAGRLSASDIGGSAQRSASEAGR
jgi:hypothetical protein